MLSPTITRAIKSGHVPALRDWRKLPVSKMTTGEKVCAFIEKHVVVPEGDLVGTHMKLLEFQEVFIQSIFDGDVRARKAILSVGRKAGKTTVISCLMLAFMFMKDLINKNSRVNSAALSKDQAGLVFNYMKKSLEQSETLAGLYKIIPSGKRIISLTTGVEFQSLAAEGSKAMGLSPAVLVGDEWGQIVGTSGIQYNFAQAMLTSQGAHSQPLAIIISTQSASDADFLSTEIDDATRSPSQDVVCHLYTADKELAINDPLAWEQACPAIGSFRSTEDVKMQAEQALRLPTAQASFENLILNRRISLSGLWLAPAVYKACGGDIDLDVFRDGTTSIGLDLSLRTDLTAAVLAARDDYGVVHLLPFVFTPEQGLKDRALRDKAPYEAWVRDGQLITVPGTTLDYDWLSEWLKLKLEELRISVDVLAFDRWRIKEFQSSAARCGFAQETSWQEVGQGYQSMSPRIEHFETLLLQGKIRHGNHPLLAMAAANAVAVSDPAGNRKLAKDRSTLRIDPIVAAVMAVGVFMEQDQPFDVEALIG